MTDRYKDKRVLVADSGHAVDFAVKLADSVGEVAYWTPAYGPDLRSQIALAGEGVDGINRVLDFWTAARESDLIVFTDAGFGEIQEQCDMLGMLTYGPGVGDALHLRRWNLKRRLEEVGLPVAESHLLTGLEQLRRFLKEREDFWIKASRFRGDFKSFRCRDYDEAQPMLEYLAAQIGAAATIYPFVAEKHVEADIELSYGGDCILGKFPEDEDYAMCGVWRESGYLGVSKPYGELPEDVRIVNEGLSGLLRQSGYAGLFSTRTRVAYDVDGETPSRFEDCPMVWNASGTGYLLGVSCRVPQVFIEWVNNWPEKVFRGARGEYVANQPTWRYTAEIGLHSEISNAWPALTVSQSNAPSVKLNHRCRIDGVDYSVPHEDHNIGSAIGLGDELEDTIESVLSVAEDAESPCIKPHTHCLFEIIEELRLSSVDLIDDDLPTCEDFETLKRRGATKRARPSRMFEPSGGGGYLDPGGAAPVIPPTPPEEVETAIAGAGGEGMLGAGGEGIEGAGGGAYTTVGGAAGEQMTGAAGELIEGANE